MTMDLFQNEVNNDNDLMSLNFKTLRLVGMWNDFKTTEKFQWVLKLFDFYGWTVYILMLIHVITVLTNIFITWGDFENLASSGSVGLMYMSAVVKQSCFKWRSKQANVMMWKFKNGLIAKSLRWSKQQEIIRQNTNRHAYIASWIYYSFGIVAAIFFMLSGILTAYPEIFGFGDINRNQTIKKLIFRASFPFDTQQSGYFETAFAFQLLLAVFGPTINSGMDAFTFSLIIHCCGQFRILKHSLRTIRERADELLTPERSPIEDKDNHCEQYNLEFKVNEHTEAVRGCAIKKRILSSNSADGNSENEYNFSQKYIDLKTNECLLECIQHHQMLLQLVADMEEVSNMMLFTQFLCSSMVICLCLFYIALMLDFRRIVPHLAFIQLLVCAVSQILLFCWYGNELTYQSDSLTTAMYESPWYDASPCYKKNLGIMMARSMKLSYFTGGKLYIVSLETFRAIMGASFSYYTVLSNLNNT